jgi:dephospho-CoA kinase
LEKIGESANIRKIAITGAISSGKSALSDFLAKQGAYVIKADDLVHKLLSNDPSIIQQIKTAFGDVLTNNTIDRKKIASLVFQDKEKLEKLEAILHPKVLEEIKVRYKTMASTSYKAFAVEFPLLFEINFASWFDTVVYVDSDPALCKKRFISRGFTEEEYSKRSARFLSEGLKKKQSDIIINNSGSLRELEEAATEILSNRDL